MGFRVWGFGCGGWGLWFRVWGSGGLGFRGWPVEERGGARVVVRARVRVGRAVGPGLEFRIQKLVLGVRVQGLGLEVKGLRFRVRGLGFRISKRFRISGSGVQGEGLEFGV